MSSTVIRFESVSSTNTKAADYARQGAEEGLCIVARQQTAGRGRHGRRWISEPDAGLYLSVILRPQIEPRRLPLLTLMAAVATCDMLKELGLDPDIKWANDVLIGEKKISGILAETVETDRGVAVVLGIGINLTSSAFPPEIAAIATSIDAELLASAGGSAMVDRQRVEQAMLEKLNLWYGKLTESGGYELVLDAWKQRSSYAAGKNVRVHMPGHSIVGVTDGIDGDGALRVKLQDGSVEIVHAGDVERLRTADN